MVRTSFLLLTLLVPGLCMGGCGANATLHRETPTGGLVSYSFETERDILTSAGRRSALRLIQEKCAQGSKILKEGEIPRVSKKADRAWQGQIATDRLWAIEFSCA